MTHRTHEKGARRRDRILWGWGITSMAIVALWRRGLLALGYAGAREEWWGGRGDSPGANS